MTNEMELMAMGVIPDMTEKAMTDKPEVVATAITIRSDDPNVVFDEIRLFDTNGPMPDGTKLIRLTDHEAARAADKARIAELEVSLKSPETVFVNMKRGVIATPSIRLWSKLFGEVLNDEDAKLLEIATIRAKKQALEKLYLETEAELLAKVQENSALRHELNACTESPGGCGYWREALKTRTSEQDLELQAQRFLLDQCQRVMRDENIGYVELNAYLSGSASIEDVLQVKAEHEAALAQQGKEGGE